MAAAWDRMRLPGVMAGLVLRLLVAAGLAVDAYVHANLAPVYDGVRASISQGNLFRIEAGVAAAAALIVLAWGRRTGFGLALAVAACGLGALLLYRYVDVGQLGPLPNMYEPSWFGEKTAAAVAEAAAVVAAAVGLVLAMRHRDAASNRGRYRRSVAALIAAGAVVAGVAVGGFAGSGPVAPACAQSPSAAGPAPSTAAGQRVTIMGTNSLRFMPATVHVRTGTVRITLMDMGAYPHNIVIPSLKVTSATVTGDPGGGTVTFTVTFRHPGSYPFYCQYHQSAGMTGMFVVSR